MIDSRRTDDNSSDSDYNVEECIKPKRIRRTVNDDSADLLGNFDDEKRRQIQDGEYNLEEDAVQSNSCDSDGSASDSKSEADDIQTSESADQNPQSHLQLTKEQVSVLMRGAAKTNRHVVYVTNLNFETTKADLEAFFSVAGPVKSVRIPKKRRAGYAFVELADLNGFQQALQLHNQELHGRQIKIQISEAGKRKSSNKKNILKQKNRKLAEMRHEPKTFTKSGKFYDKALKQQKAKELLERKRWRKQPKRPQ